jgi:triacylglycerol lipase
MAKHIVLVPGFIGFDALGSLRYYAGVTEEFRSAGFMARGSLDYFDNFPTASVGQRAERLRRFLAKKWARGEFQPGDELTLVGHSTGGLDIRRLLRDLRFGPYDANGAPPAGPIDTHVDGCSVPVTASALRGLIRRIVFLSVPHFGTNVADYFFKLKAPIRAGAAAAADGVRANQALPAFLSGVVPGVTGNSGCDLFTAVADTLRETDDSCPPLKKADEREARYQLLLWLDHMHHDVSALADLRSYDAVAPSLESPAFYGQQERSDELAELASPPDLPAGTPMPAIDVLSFATRVRHPSGRGPLSGIEHWGAMTAASVAKFAGPPVRAASYLMPGSALLRDLFASGLSISALARFGWDPAALFWSFQAICADASLPFHAPPGIAPSGTHWLGNNLAFSTATDLVTADNDGIVNTLSMLWPYDPQRRTPYTHYLVNADHADIIGHYVKVPEREPSPTGRQWSSYDIFQSGSGFTDAQFQSIWRNIFQFAL